MSDDGQWNVAFTFVGGTASSGVHRHFGPYNRDKASAIINWTKDTIVLQDEDGLPVRVNYNLATVVGMYRVS